MMNREYLVGMGYCCYSQEEPNDILYDLSTDLRSPVNVSDFYLRSKNSISNQASNPRHLVDICSYNLGQM